MRIDVVDDNVVEWIYNLPTQTLTDELKEDIVDALGGVKELYKEYIIERLSRGKSELLRKMNEYVEKNYTDENLHDEYADGGYIGDPIGCMNEGEVTGFERAQRIVKEFFGEE